MSPEAERLTAAAALIFGGGVFLQLARHLLWRLAKLPTKDSGAGPSLPGWVVGIAERLFFTWIVAATLPSAPTAMMAWLALKMGANWNRQQESPSTRAYAFCALACGLTSMGMALGAGLILQPAVPGK